METFDVAPEAVPFPAAQGYTVGKFTEIGCMQGSFTFGIASLNKDRA